MGVGQAPDRRTAPPDPPVRGRGARGSRLGLPAVGLAVGIFAVDVLTPLEGAVAVLYTVVVLLAARAYDRRGVVLMAAACMVLTAAAYGLTHRHGPVGSPLLRCLVSLVAIAITTTLVLQNQRTTAALADQAGLLDLTHDAIFVRDARHVVTFWNRGAEELYGWPRAEALGRDADDLLRTSVPAGPAARAAALLRTGRWEGELIHTTRSGATVAVESRWAVRRDGGGGVLAVLETDTDVTARRAAGAALRAVRAELAHAARRATLGELTASIAHEVNQPLAAVVTNGEAALRWLDRDVPDLDETAAALARVVANGRRAGAIVARIRAFLAKASPPHERFALEAMIGEAALLIEHEMAQHGVRLEQAVEAGLPAVPGDRVQLQQVVINLMVNGIQAMAAVRDRPRLLRVRARREGEGVLVEVADGGTGVAPQDADRLFTPFFTTRADGMGLGLSICRSTVEAHGGRIWASGREGAGEGPGATFRFTLPLSGVRPS